jgi:uncharacterized protein (TIGR00369 family)
MSEPPAGFGPHFRKSPVTDPWEPLYSRVGPGLVEIGAVVKSAHCNSRGFLHGGVVAALADNAMGLAFGFARREQIEGASGTGALTLSLSLDYVAPAKLGQWLQVTPRLLKAGRSIGFVDALVTADGETIARASATFRIIE